jgi:hypothetical protein
MYRFGERDIGLYIDEQLGLEEGSYELKAAAKRPRLLLLVMKQQRGILCCSGIILVSNMIS